MGVHVPALYEQPPAVAKAYKQRRYSSLQLELHAAALERKARLATVVPLAPTPDKIFRVIHDELFVHQPIDCKDYAEAHSILDREVRSFPKAREIIVFCCILFHIEHVDMMSSRRLTSIVWPRQICMWLIHRLRRDSLPMIGHHMGDKDHTTVLHAIRKVQAKYDSDPEFAAFLDMQRRRLGWRPEVANDPEGAA